MKLKKLFGGLFLSFALIAGVGAGLAIKEHKAENVPVEKVAADSWHVVGGQSFYLDCRSFSDWVTADGSSAKFKIYFANNQKNGWATSSTKVENYLFRFTVPGDADTVYTLAIALRASNTSADWSGEHNRSGDISLSGKNNAIKIKGWDSNAEQSLIEPTYKDLFFTDSQSWSNVYVHYWGGDLSTVWPGVGLTLVSYNGDNQGVYKASVPANAGNLIFNNNNDDQTATISSPSITGLSGYYISGGNKGSRTTGTWTVGTVNSGDILYLNYNLPTFWDDSTAPYQYLYCFNEINGGSAMWAKGRVIYNKGATDRLIEYVVPGTGKSFITVIFARNTTDTASFDNTRNQSCDYYPGFCYTSSNINNVCVLKNQYDGSGHYLIDFNNTYPLSNEARADFYGVYFNSQVTCAGQTIDVNSWPSTVTSEFSAMPQAIKTIVTNKTGQYDGGSDHLATAVYRYDYIISKYGKTKYNDFLGRIAAGKLSVTGTGFMPFESLTTSSNGTPMLVIIIVSIVSVTAVGGYFFLRKRRNEK